MVALPLAAALTRPFWPVVLDTAATLASLLAEFKPATEPDKDSPWAERRAVLSAEAELLRRHAEATRKERLRMHLEATLDLTVAPELRLDADTVQADHASIHAGSLLKAHGGFILLHLHDLAAEEGLWPRLRRFLRCNRLAIEDTAASHGSGATVARASQPAWVVRVLAKILATFCVQACSAMLRIRMNNGNGVI